MSIGWILICLIVLCWFYNEEDRKHRERCERNREHDAE